MSLTGLSSLPVYAAWGLKSIKKRAVSVMKRRAHLASWLKDGLLRRIEAKRNRVDAVAQPGCILGAVVEDMPQV